MVESLALQSDGKILVGGSFANYNGIGRKNILRLNSDGSLDTSFDPGSGAGGSSWGVMAIAVQPSDSKILIGGDFTSYNSTSVGRIVRLNADGTIDSTFNNGQVGANNFVYAIAIQSDYKILIGGGFSTYNGVSQYGLARLTTSGAKDSTFTITYSARPDNTILLQSDGKIMAGGTFTAYNGVVRDEIARVNTDGTLDTTFLPYSNEVGISGGAWGVMSILQLGDGNFIVGGDFTGYNGVARGCIVRIWNN